MQITFEKENSKLTIFVSGRVDTVTAPELDTFIADNTQGVNELVLDLKDMSYTSSSGLRVILKAQKLMNQQGTMKVINVQKDVMDIFDMTGFSGILTIE
jgi:anti-sigma B factor antagonist